MTAADSPLAEALHDRYVLERELGRGGMATVYLARDLRHDRLVALKVLHSELAATLGPERFLREVRTTARLQHPHILPVLDSGEAAGQLWYTMPYVRGESLRERLRREVQLPVEAAVGLARQVALALDFAHREGVVHRDLKPENILLSDGQALVADFGVAKALAVGNESQLTETGMAVGTPAYMSPEQASAGQVDGRSDVYALGCVLYEMLVGEPPYSGPTPQAILARRMRDPVPSLRTVRESVPETVEKAITRALARVPADRFTSAGEFARALSLPIPTATTATTLSAPARRTLRPTRRQVALLAMLCLALAGGVLARARLGGKTASAGKQKMLAVLPFENLGRAEDEYFADGLTEEITSRLASVKDLGVISRTSAMQYKAARKPLKQIGRELGVDYLLEGSVRWQKSPAGVSRIRVTPQLIRVSDDSHLWADRYDADLADIFQVQGNIAERVTSALDVALQDPERRILTVRPTANLTAYDAYLRGNALYPAEFTGGLDRIVTALRRAAEQYREATRLDSTFALAYAKLGTALIFQYRYGAHEAATSAAGKQAIDRAFALSPSLSDAHLARGLYHFLVGRDTVDALRELQLALAERPNDAELLIHLADLEWHARGPASQPNPHAERAVLLDPHSAGKLLVLASMYRDQQRFDEAERLYDRAIALDPRSPGPYAMKAFVHLLRDGDTTGARAIVRSAAQRMDSMALITAAVTNANQATWHALGMLDEPYQRALLTLRPEAFGGDTAWFGLAEGYAYRARGDSLRFHAYWDTAFAVASAQLRKRPNDYWYRLVTSWVLAGRGERAAAYAAMAQAQALYGAQFSWMERQARLALVAGDYDRALSTLERGRWGPNLTIPWLCADHFWDPLRPDPRFQRIVKGRCR